MCQLDIELRVTQLRSRSALGGRRRRVAFGDGVGGGSFELLRFSLLCPATRRSSSSSRAVTAASFASCAFA